MRATTPPCAQRVHILYARHSRLLCYGARERRGGMRDTQHCEGFYRARSLLMGDAAAKRMWQPGVRNGVPAGIAESMRGVARGAISKRGNVATERPHRGPYTRALDISV